MILSFVVMEVFRTFLGWPWIPFSTSNVWDLKGFFICKLCSCEGCCYSKFSSGVATNFRECWKRIGWNPTLSNCRRGQCGITWDWWQCCTVEATGSCVNGKRNEVQRNDMSLAAVNYVSSRRRDACQTSSSSVNFCTITKPILFILKTD